MSVLRLELPAAVGIALVCLLSASAAQAVVQNYTMSIDNAQEQAAGNCLIGSTAQGSGTATLDTATLMFSWNLTFGNNAPNFNDGLLQQGVENNAHFHLGAPGVSGGVVHGVALGSPKVGSTTVTALEAADIQNGLWYINIHSTGCVPGEIRGQVLLVPAAPAEAHPATGLLVAIVLATIGALALRPRRVA